MSTNELQPLFMEETFLVNLYGTEEEVEQFYDLMDELNDMNVVEIIHLIEDIKRRNVTKIYWNCCHRCQNFESCRINWYRGENKIKKNCCSLCENYEDCLARMKRQQETCPETDTFIEVRQTKIVEIEVFPPVKNKS